MNGRIEVSGLSVRGARVVAATMVVLSLCVAGNAVPTLGSELGSPAAVVAASARASVGSAVALAAVKKKVTPKIRVTRMSRSWLKAGESVTVTGRTSAVLRGRVVKLQTRDRGVWKTFASAKVTKGRRFTLRGMVATVGSDVPVRVLAAATAKTRRKAVRVGFLRVLMGDAKLAVTSVTRSLRVGDALVVKGTASRLLAGKSVSLLIDRGTMWERLLTTKVTSQGTYVFEGPAPSVGDGQQIRVQAWETRATPVDEVDAGTIDVAKADVSITGVVGAASAEINTDVPISGTASLMLAGQPFLVDGYFDGYWGQVGQGMIGEDGRYQVSAQFPVAAKSVAIRVRVEEYDTTKAFQIGIGTIEVWQWRYLSDLEEVYSDDFASFGSARIGSSVYPSSVTFDDWDVSTGHTQAAIWNVEAGCSTLEATVGIATTAVDHGISYVAQVEKDGATSWSDTITYDAPKKVSLNLAGAARVQLDAIYNQDDLDRDNGLVFGNARVRCAP